MTIAGSRKILVSNVYLLFSMIPVERAYSALHCPLDTVLVYPDLTVSFNSPRQKVFLYQSMSFHFNEFQGKVALFNYWGNCLVYKDLPETLLQVSPDTTGIFSAIRHYMFYKSGRCEVFNCGQITTVKTLLNVDAATLMLLCPHELQEIIDA